MKRVIAAEFLKYRRTLALWLAAIVPVVVVVVTGFSSLRVGMYQPGATDGWQTLFRESLGLWIVLIVPMFVALQAALASNLEHAHHMYKQLFALPPPRWHFFAAKCVAVATIVALAHVLLVVASLSVGLVIQASGARPDLVWDHLGRELLVAAGATAGCFALSLFMVALYVYLSVRFSNILVVLGVGIAAPLLLENLITSRLLVKMLPWLIPFNALWPYVTDPKLLVLKEQPLLPYLTTVVGAIVFVALGCRLVEKRDVLD